MGAWDYKPFDNDDACDFKDEIEECKSNKEIKKCIEKNLEYPYAEYHRAIVNYLLDGLYNKDRKKYLKLALDKMKQSCNDKWIESWKEPDKIKSLIEEEYKRAEKFLKTS